MDIGYAEKMPNWTKYKGFPVVNVKMVNSSCIEVDQKPFSINSLFEKMAKRLAKNLHSFYGIKLFSDFKCSVIFYY